MFNFVSEKLKKSLLISVYFMVYSVILRNLFRAGEVGHLFYKGGGCYVISYEFFRITRLLSGVVDNTELENTHTHTHTHKASLTSSRIRL